MSRAAVITGTDLIALLQRETGLEAPELRKLRDQATSTGQSFDRVLIGRGLKEDAVLRAFAKDLDLPFHERFENIQVPRLFVEHVPLAFARAHDMVAISTEGEELVVACAHPLDLHPQDDLLAMLPCRVRFSLAPR